MTDLNDWELEQRAFHAAAKGVETTATPEQMQELIRDLWKALCLRDEELRQTQEHAQVLVEALAEIKATNDGQSTQPIGDIIAGCAHEVGELRKAHRQRDNELEEQDPFDKEVDVPYVGFRPGG